MPTVYSSSEDLRGREAPKRRGSTLLGNLLLSLFLLVSSASTIRAQNFNPNNLDPVATMKEIEHPHSDLIILSSHRGNHALVDGKYPNIPENSLDAIGSAAMSGIEEIELDVKLTSDGVPILSHDQTWGRETCFWFGAGVVFDPFGSSSGGNASLDPLVSSLSLAQITSPSHNAKLRDTISIINAGPGNEGGCTPPVTNDYPPTLQEALTYMTQKGIGMVLALDLRDAPTAAAAWSVINANKDLYGNPYSASTLFKIPLKAFSSPSAFVSTFPSGQSQLVHFQPVINTSDIAPTAPSTDIENFGGVDVAPAAVPGYGSEQNIIQALYQFENASLIDVTAVEVQYKQVNGILTNLLEAARTNNRTGQQEPLTVFSPFADYYAPGDTNRANALFFSTLGYCCGGLNQFYYNPKNLPDGTVNPNYDASQPSDTADNRPSLLFLYTQKYNGITTDNPVSYNAQLEGAGLRNINHIINGAQGPGAAREAQSSCDLYASGGTPCVAAHSTVRALSQLYNGNLYRVQRASDGTSTDIEVLSASGYADAAKQDSFCAGTACTITTIYDQTNYHNDLSIEGPGGNKKTPDFGALANALPVMIHGNKVYGLSVTPGVGYRNNATHGVSRTISSNGNVAAAPEGMYMVTSGTNVNSGCCFDYGNAETTSDDDGNGRMDSVNFQTECFFAPCSGSGPWVSADMENGLFQGNYSNTNNKSVNFPFVTAMLKNDTVSTFALKTGNAQSGGLTTQYSGSLPQKNGKNSGYTPMMLEGAIVLGTGGDNSATGIGSFFEGVMTSGYPTDAAEDAVQANIVAAGYTGSSNPTNGEASTYTGPSDPDGPGPQDGFAGGGVEQGNDIMGTKPAMAFFNQKIFAAFQANDSSHTLFVTSTTNGQPYPAAVPAPDVQIGSAPAMAVYRHQLYIGFQADNSSHHLFITSSPDGSNFPHATGYPNISMGSAPAMVEWRHQLLVAFQADDPSHYLFVTASEDGTNFPAATEVPNVQIGSAPALAVFRNTLYVAFRADDSSNDLWVASSSDGVTFASKRIAGFTNAQTTGPKSSPALVVSNGVLYCIYGADDLGNEMLVMATTDGVAWQGPNAYLGVQMGASGPGATATGVGLTVGFQSNDARNVLYTTYKTTQGTSYTGPSDPNGSGPQDDFPTPAAESSAVKMGSKPAFATNGLSGTTFAAFQANDASHLLYVTSAKVGSTFPGVYGQAADAIGSAPAEAIFNGKLYVGFQADNSSDHLFITSSSDGTSFPHATGYPNLQIGSAPAMAVFNNKLYVAFQADDASHFLYVTSSSDGSTFPTAKGYGNIAIGSAPSMAVFKGNLYIAFRADDTSNDVWIASSSDGVNFSSRRIAGADNPQQMGWQSSPTLVVSGTNLYCAWGANDLANELIVMASSDGSSWQGPKAYPGIRMGATGPGGGTITGTGGVPLAAILGFQSDDTANILFTTQTQ